jgi:NADH dehydrogenase
LALAIRLRRTAPHCQVVLLDRAPSHFWKPRLHEVAAGLLGSGEDETSFLAHGKRHGFEFHYGAMIDVDFVRKIVWLDTVAGLVEPNDELLGRREFSYDVLVLAIGSRVNDFGVPGVVEHCHMLDSPQQARALHHAFLEQAFLATTHARRRVRVGIVGAGATGVELAAELHHANRDLQRFGGFGPADRLDIVLIDRGTRILPGADARTSARATETLERLGVTLRLGEGVQSVSPEGFHLPNDEVVGCHIKVWASGVVGHDVVGALKGVTLGPGRRIVVDRWLAVEGLEDVYALGDCALSPPQASHSPPPTAQVAHQQAVWLSRALPSRLDGRPAKPFVYAPKGMVVSLGANDAAAELPPLSGGHAPSASGGLTAKALYLALAHMHRVTLHGWWRAGALLLADRLRGVSTPPVKLH